MGTGYDPFQDKQNLPHQYMTGPDPYIYLVFQKPSLLIGHWSK